MKFGMGKNLKSSSRSIFTIFLVSYFLVLTVPILIGGISYVISAKSIKEQLISYNKSLLEQAASTIDGYLYNIDQYMSSIYMDSEISNFLYVHDANSPDSIYSISRVSKNLSNYRNSNQFINYLYIYFHNTELIVDTSTKYSTNFFYKSKLTYSGVSFDQWKNMLSRFNYKSSFSNNVTMDETERKKVITYVQSLPISERTNPLASLVVHVDAEKLENILKQIEVFSHGSVFILDGSGNPLMSIGDEKLLVSDILSNIALENNSSVQKIDGKEKVVSCRNSAFSKWKYISILPTQLFMQKVNNIKSIMMYALLFELLMGIAVSIVLAKKNYLPIKRLVEKVSKSNGYLTSGLKNELMFLEEVTEAVFLESSESKRLLKENQPVLRANILSRLLRGNINVVHSQDDTSFLNQMQIFFDHDSFCVLSFNLNTESIDGLQYSNQLKELSLAKLIVSNVADELANKNFKAYVVDADWDIVVLIINIKGEETEVYNKVYGIARTAMDFIYQHYNMLLTAGIGKVYEGVDKISLSYRQSLKALEYKLIRGEHSVIVYEEISEQRYDFSHNPILEAQLLNNIKSGDKVKVMLLLDELFTNNFRNTGISIEMARCMFFDIMNMGLRVLDSLNVDFEAVFGHELQPATKIINCRTIEEMNSTLRAIYNNICDYIISNRKCHSEDLKNRILVYISENFYNSTLSLTTIAEAFNMNATYLSYFISEQLGDSFINYISKLRIERAKNLLRSSALPLSEVAEKVGYINPGTLTRVFKKLEGVTPSQFREQAGKDAD